LEIDVLRPSLPEKRSARRIILLECDSVSPGHFVYSKYRQAFSLHEDTFRSLGLLTSNESRMICAQLLAVVKACEDGGDAHARVVIPSLYGFNTGLSLDEMYEQMMGDFTHGLEQGNLPYAVAQAASDVAEMREKVQKIEALFDLMKKGDVDAVVEV
jgi:hypothetical protein